MREILFKAKRIDNGEMADGCEDCLLYRKTEVIGNIFDNPELLEGGAA